ncbi:hypothetical protein [Hydrogenobacter thermophilus]|uniref:hypothetical protein n=1 Tax=Hydrogenobacter thermophilus TaxID=940 RepID=UPI0030F8AB0A
MFTDGRIWATMLELKVFRLEDVVKALNPPSHLRSWVKERVRSAIAQQLKFNLLRVVVEDPPVYSTIHATEEDIKKFYKQCCVCSKEFIPKQDKQVVCSRECKQLYYRGWHKEHRKELGMAVDTRRRWTKEELKLLEPLLTRQAEKGEYEKIAKRLGRGVEAVRFKVKKLRRRYRYAEQ